MFSSGTILTAALLFVCGFASGYLMHRSDFCMAGAFRDLFMFSRSTMLKALLVLIATAALLFEIESLLGLVVTPFPFFTAPTLFGLLGGILFGFGMVIAGGCVIGVLYKSGSGSRPALTALVGLIVGSGIYAEFHQTITPLINQTKLTTSVTLPQLTGVSTVWWMLVLVAGTVFAGRRWLQSGDLKRTSAADGYVQPWQAAVMLALLVAVGAAVSGVPFGVTTSYLKFAAVFEQLLVPQHMATLPLFAAQPISHMIPLSGDTLVGGAGPGIDVVALIQYPIILGIILGATWSSARLKEWSWHGHFPLAQAVTVFSGGIFMAFGARFASGCNVWHLWGGLPVFAIQSLLFLLGLFPGALLGSQVIKRIILGRV